MLEHPYGWLSLLPPLLAITLAIATRRVVLSLLAGILGGALILSGGDPIVAVASLFENHLWKTATDPTNLRIFTFTLLMGGMVGVISRAGVMHGLIHLVTPWAKDRRRGQLTAWLAGLFIFFDDYANSIVLGNTLRAFSDRLRISREKLAFLVDATAAPVAGIAPLSTWVAIELLQINEGLKNAGVADQDVSSQAFELFLWSIPYRFYALWMLAFIPLVAITLRDFGPMRRAEREMFRTGKSHGRIDAGHTDMDHAKPRWINAVLPIGLTLGLLVWLLYQTGAGQVIALHGMETFSALPWGERARAIMGKSDSPLALMYGSLAGLVLSTVMARTQHILSWGEIRHATESGMKTMLPAIAILVTAMTLSGMTKGNLPKPGEQPFAQQETRLYTGVYLSELLLGEEGENRPGADAQGMRDGSEVNRQTHGRRQWLTWMFPTIVFLLSAVVAFCTGTSYGTMGILMPMTISLACSLLGGVESVAAGHPILLGAIGGVLAGSIFGDHCSPISDTTVLSSQASGCNHLDHVWTQMPYAVVVAAVAVVCGTLPLGFGVSVWILLPLGIVAMIGLLLLLGRSEEEELRMN